MKTVKRFIACWLCCFLLAALAGFSSLPGRAAADDGSPSAGTAANGSSSIAQIAGGKGFTVLLKKDGTVWTWGDNLRGKLGGGMENRTYPSQVAGVSNIISISTGGFHTLALKSDGTVWAWGENSFGQLGDGTTADRNSPVQVSGLTDVIAVAAGFYHSVALKKDGTVWAWGDNTYGQLGNGNNDQQSKPVQVKGNLPAVTAIAAGAYHTLAIDGEGIVWAWGDNYYGELGYGYDQNTLNTPIMATSNGWHITQVAGGYNFSMALKDDGTVLTWGLITSNQANFGSTGIGVTDEQKFPTLVIGLQDVQKIAAGNSHALALTKDGSVYAWGDNSSGQLGVGTGFDGRTWNQSLPDLISGLKDIALIGAGYNFTFAVGKDNSLWAWGNNSYGQLGDGTTNNQSSPEQIKSLVTVSQPILQPGEGTVLIDKARQVPLAAGESTTFAVKNNRLYGWGDNTFGQLGDGTNAAALSPEGPSSLQGVSMVAAGSSHTLAVKSDGTLWAWGQNYFGQLGDGTTENRTSPKQVSVLKGVVAAAAGSNHTVALLNNGTVWTFGDNTYGQLGYDTAAAKRGVPAPVAPLSDIVAVASGANFSLALKNDGTVWAWGDNTNGQLGDGTYAAKHLPVQVQGLKDAVAIAAGKNHALALKNDGTVWAWGYNAFGQLGDGTTTNRTKPVQLTAITGISAISAGAYHSMAVKSDGTVWTWGQDLFGQLGDGMTANQSSPVQVKGISGAVYAAAGGTHSAVMLKDGTVWTWGGNYSGQLGDGTRTNRTSPAMVTGLSVKFNDVDGHWAKDAIYRAAEKGYVDGYADGSFRPDNSVTRAEFLKLVTAALQLPVTGATADQAWYQPYADAAAKAGIYQIGDLQADWNAPITRQEIAVVALRAADASLQKPNTALDANYAMYNAAQKGILQGFDGGRLAPQETTTRAQSVTVLERILAVRQGQTLPVDAEAVQNAEAVWKAAHQTSGNRIH